MLCVRAQSMHISHISHISHIYIYIAYTCIYRIYAPSCVAHAPSQHHVLAHVSPAIRVGVGRILNIFQGSNP